MIACGQATGGILQFLSRRTLLVLLDLRLHFGGDDRTELGGHLQAIQLRQIAPNLARINVARMHANDVIEACQPALIFAYQGAGRTSTPDRGYIQISSPLGVMTAFAAVSV